MTRLTRLGHEMVVFKFFRGLAFSREISHLAPGGHHETAVIFRPVRRRGGLAAGGAQQTTTPVIGFLSISYRDYYRDRDDYRGPRAEFYQHDRAGCIAAGTIIMATEL